MSAFDVAVGRILDSEGRDAFTDRPDDMGGPTRWGITWKTYETAIGRGIVPAGLLSKLDRDGAVAIYRALYWTPMHCDDLPPGLAFILFDSAVNSGVPAASKWLQGTLVRWGQDVKIDGVIGPVTVAAAKRVSGLADAFLATRAEALMGFVKEDPTQQKWLHGWLTREFRVGREAGVL